MENELRSQEKKEESSQKAWTSGESSKFGKLEWTETLKPLSEIDSQRVIIQSSSTKTAGRPRKASKALEKDMNAAPVLPKRRTPQGFQSPWNPKNRTQVWILPKPDELVSVLRQFAGDVDALINHVCEKEEYRLLLLFGINDLLSQPDNERYKREWEKLKQIGEDTKLEMLKAAVIHDVTMEPQPNRRKTEFGRNARKIGDLKDFWGFKAKKEGTKKEQKEEEQSDSMTAALDAIRRQLLTDEDIECQDQAVND